MYRIKPYYEYIQTELVNYIKNTPDQWQAKVLACLSFSIVFTFDEIMAKTNLSPIFVLKALIISEQFNVTIYCNDGWIMNKKLDAESLNDYLDMDITEHDISNDRRMKRLIDGLPLQNKKVSTIAPILTEKEKAQSADILIKQSRVRHKSTGGSSYIENINELNLDRPVEGSGRKKSEEWNKTEAIDFGRKLREAIARKNEEQREESSSKSLPKKDWRKAATLDEANSERLYIKLCTNYPDYEAFITRHHKKDNSYKMMKLVESKILSDLSSESVNSD